jgi:hypothetical protein
MPELYSPSSHFHKKGGVLHLTATDKLALESEVRTMEDINVIELLSSTTFLTTSRNHMRSLGYPDGVFEIEGCCGISGWEELKNCVKIAASQGGTGLSTYSSRCSPSKE